MIIKYDINYMYMTNLSLDLLKSATKPSLHQPAGEKDAVLLPKKYVRNYVTRKLLGSW